ncbi:hypothetical protein TRFO_38286 [Tritrichomonas foetus]|uniref:DUF3447 domain-containing protein n=1 Tax=Tritrichomonas foetus TaxID=1144522 RepID=A0A1J4JAA0_9EUKA|nr:hypothetical protein TRFO_38286 [Tritrichomonas foetus]|eukprot:OHS95601.1 hypothetical protein TRFO_38286 [Tritrichomonas foetus]
MLLEKGCQFTHSSLSNDTLAMAINNGSFPLFYKILEKIENIPLYHLSNALRMHCFKFIPILIENSEVTHHDISLFCYNFQNISSILSKQTAIDLLQAYLLRAPNHGIPENSIEIFFVFLWMFNS